MSVSRLTVSVIIPTYNRAHLVCEAIDSCLAQTRVPDEIIVVDDGSTDETRTVLAKYNYPVIIVTQDNKGRSAARNVGLKKASCDLIAFLDSDDTLPRESIARRVEVLSANPNIALVYTGAMFQDMNGNNVNWFRKPPLPSGKLFAELVCRSVFPIHAAMFRRECLAVVPQFDAQRMLHEDLVFWRQLSQHYEFQPIDEPLANYRLQPTQTIATDVPRQIREEIDLRIAVFNEPSFKQLTPLECARAYSVHATQHMLLGDAATARHWYWKAIRTAPWLPRPYVLMALTLFGKRGLDTVSGIWKRLRGLWSRRKTTPTGV